MGHDGHFLERLDRVSRPMVSGRGDLIVGLHALARCEVTRGQLVVAETLLARGVMIREQTRGLDSPMIADALVELAAFHRARGRMADAEALAARAVARRAVTPGFVLARARYEPPREDETAHCGPVALGSATIGARRTPTSTSVCRSFRIRADRTSTLGIRRLRDSECTSATAC